jgi:uncharacterized protein
MEVLNLKAIIFFILQMLISSSLCVHADPWGKDADLVSCDFRPPPSLNTCPTPLMGQLAECLIGFHQTVITPIDGPRSNYLPSSSQYTLDAMRKYGFFTGFTMGCDRLMRENDDPWVYPQVIDIHGYPMKYDPVP